MLAVAVVVVAMGGNALVVLAEVVLVMRAQHLIQVLTDLQTQAVVVVAEG
jgi:hypothetical protein